MVLRAAQAGHPEAQYWVGIHLRYETYCTDINKMQPWVEQAAASQLATPR